MDPYVYVEIHGIPVDCTERRTRTVTQNGDNPIFDESFEFQINLPELAMVRFVVLDDDFIGDEFIGRYQESHWKCPEFTLLTCVLSHRRTVYHPSGMYSTRLSAHTPPVSDRRRTSPRQALRSCGADQPQRWGETS